MSEATKNLPRTVGPYEIGGRLAFGGMAEILLARRTGRSGFDRAVVIKRILPQFAEQPAFVSMFIDEARILASIHHPNVVQVFELGEEADDLYLVMEYIQGESISSLERRLKARGERIPLDLAAYVIDQICSGLQAAHERGVVHRDISPDNVLISYDGSVKVVDFGIAKADNRLTRTESGEVKGKFAYMSPEQVRGEELDRRSDIFAIGTCAFELITLHKLFRRKSTVETIRALQSEPVPAASSARPDCPAALDQVVLRALERAPRDRWQDAREMRDALRRAYPVSTARAPDVALAELMRSLGDRIAEKDALLARLREREVIDRVPSAEVDIDVDLPSIIAKVPAAPSSTRRSRLVLALLSTAVVALLAVISGYAAGIIGPSEAPITEIAPAATAPLPPPNPDTTVRTEQPSDEAIPTSPEVAEIVLDGTSRDASPTTITPPSSDTPPQAEGRATKTRRRRSQLAGREGTPDPARPDDFHLFQ